MPHDESTLPLLATNNTISYKNTITNILKLMGPVGIGYGITITSEFTAVSLIFAGHENGLEISALVTAITHLLRTTGCANLFITSTYTSQTIADNTPEQVGIIFRKSLLISAMQAVLAIAPTWFAKTILTSFGQPPKISASVQEYFRAYSWGMLGSFALMSTNQIAVGLKKSSISLYTTLIQKIIYLSLGYCLTFGEFNLPELGMTGLGLANAISTWLVFLGTMGIFKINKKFDPYKFFRCDFTKNHKLLWNLIKDGFPIGMRYGIDMATSMATVLMIGAQGLENLAPAEIATQCSYIVKVLLIATANATNVFVKESQQLGNNKQLRKYSKTSLALGGSWGLIALGTSLLFTPELCSLFFDPYNPDNADKFALTKKFLTISMIGQLFNSASLVSNGILQGINDTSYATKISLATSIFGLAAAYFLGFFTPCGATCTWLSVNSLASSINATAMVKRVGTKIHNASCTFFSKAYSWCCPNKEEQPELSLNSAV